jgi:hypothetical protein
LEVAHERRKEEKVGYEQERAGNGNGEKGIHIIRAGDFFDAVQQHDKHDRGGNIGNQDESDELTQQEVQDEIQAGRECGGSEDAPKAEFKPLVELLDFDHQPKESKKNHRLNGETDALEQEIGQHGVILPRRSGK